MVVDIREDIDMVKLEKVEDMVLMEREENGMVGKIFINGKERDW